MNNSLHIVAFDMPYPPIYGGIIDVFYKIKALHKLGVKIHLHIFVTNTTQETTILKRYCETISFYKRKNFFFSMWSYLPFRVKSRTHNALYKNLTKKDYPILFEGLHSAYLISKYKFKNCYLRAHNIEHNYFYGLYKSEKNILKKLYFLIESKKLKYFEKNLHHIDGIFSIAPFEQNYFNKHYQNAHYIPVFHKKSTIRPNIIKEKFVLYHGDLRVADNIKAALFLIETYKNTPYKLVIAGNNINSSLLKKINKYTNISWQVIPTQDSLDQLLQKAILNVLVSFQKTGIKLKLLHALYKGNFVIGNSYILEDTGLEILCFKADSKTDILKQTEHVFKQNLSVNTKERVAVLNNFSPDKSAKQIVKLIFN